MRGVRLITIRLQGNKNCIISDNNIIFQNFSSYIGHNDNVPIDLTIRESGKFDELIENKLQIFIPEKRHIIENDKIERLVKLSKLYKYNPILRIYGCFSSIATIRQESEHSDIAQLELLEKKSVFEFINNNFEVRIIVYLDTNSIFSKNMYSVEQYVERCEDVIRTVARYNSYKNLRIVVDNFRALDGMHIYDTMLICQMPTIMFDHKAIDYNYAVFDSDINIVTSCIKAFDNRFYQLEYENQLVMNNIGCENFQDYFRNVYKMRQDNYFRKMQ